ncbi:hypothetical protein LOD99_16180 [Oopsacas minuta]|uniref:1-phosphatidylinositol 4,5-bisphosphate phosphodiesterase n=1 Tax=Oopsacas minuta TaxID=111878 RepID=A0AAV7K743_9METZ|nr:hypothetical protein LOD99_16180 [Oopsacas minuta]
MSEPIDDTSELQSTQFLRFKEGDSTFDLVKLDLHKYFIRASSIKKLDIRLYDISLISDARGQKLPIMTPHLTETIKSKLGTADNLEEHVMCLVCRNELKWHYIVRPTMYYFFGGKSVICQWITVVNRVCIFKDFLHLPLLSQLDKMHEQIKLSATNPSKLPLDVLLKIIGTDTKRKSRIVEALAKIGLINTDRSVNTDKMSFLLFFKFYLTLTRDRCDIMKTVLSPEKQFFDKKEFQNFINVTQRDPRLNSLNYPPLVVRKIAKLISEYDNKKESDAVSFEGVVRYLMSKDNLEIDSTQFDQTQDMDKPISSYYINSSHNSYLEGRQMMALGSVEMYIQCMLLGCRCVELDCWDDINDEPVITHGGAFVNKLNFEEVIKAIAEYAFIVTEYPLVLSFENRSKNPIVQDKMVQICKKHFGEMLLDLPLDSHPLEENVFLPSPNMLKRKILIKNKRLLPPERTKTQIDLTDIPDVPPQRKDRMSTLVRHDAKIPKEFENLKELDEEMSTFESDTTSTVDTLVNYVQASKFSSFEECFNKNISYEMFSFSESKAYGYIMNQPKLFTMYNKFQVSRIYPYWKRINSDNLMPQIFWNVGCQMVALNFQTPDLPIMLNHAKFEYNNRRGYIFKPSCLHLYRHEAFNAFAQVSIPYVVSASFQLRVISAQFIRPDINSKIFVSIEIYGLPADTIRNETSWNTNAVPNNFLVEFDSDICFKAERILLPDLAMVKFNVFEEGNKLIAHRTLAFLGLKTGFRHILLRDKNIHPAGISSLFVEIKIEDYVPPEAESIVQSLVSPQSAAKIEKKAEDDEEAAKLYRIRAMRSLMGSGELGGIELEIAEEGMKSAPKQITVDTFTALQTQRKLPPILEEVMQRSHTIDPLGREHVGENKALESKLVKEILHLSKAQSTEREKFKKFLLKELAKFSKDSKKETVKLSLSLTERGVTQELEARLKVRENELDEQMKEKEGAFLRAEEALKISHNIKRTTLAINQLQTIHKDQVNALMRKSSKEEHTMLSELSDEEKTLIRSGEVGLDKKGVARIRMEIREMIILKKRKSLPQLQRLQKLEFDKLLISQREYIKQMEDEVNGMKENLGRLVA